MSRENDEDSNFKRPALVRAVVKRENEEDSIKNVHPKSKSQIVNSIRENDLPKISSTSKRENDAEQKVKIRRENEDDGIKNIHPIAKSQIINIVRENDLPKVSSAIKRENDAEQRIKIKREQEDEQDSSQIENQRENERNKNGEIKRDENENQSSEIRSLTGFSSQSRRENDEDSDEEAEQSNEMSKEIHQQLIGLEIDSQKQERERIKQQMKKVNEQELLVPLDKQRGIDIIMKQMAQENLLEVSDQVQSAQNGEPAKKILLLDNVTPGSKPSEWQLNPAVEQQAQKAHVTRDAMPEILGGLQGADIMRSEPFVIPPHYEVEDLFWDRVKLDALIVERNQLLSESWNKETTIKRLEFILNSRTRELHTLEQKMTTEKNRQKNNNLQKLEQIKTLKAKVQQNEEEKIKLAQALKQKEELDKNNESVNNGVENAIIQNLEEKQREFAEKEKQYQKHEQDLNERIKQLENQLNEEKEKTKIRLNDKEKSLENNQNNLIQGLQNNLTDSSQSSSQLSTPSLSLEQQIPPDQIESILSSTLSQINILAHTQEKDTIRIIHKLNCIVKDISQDHHSPNINSQQNDQIQFGNLTPLQENDGHQNNIVNNENNLKFNEKEKEIDQLKVVKKSPFFSNPKSTTVQSDSKLQIKKKYPENEKQETQSDMLLKGSQSPLPLSPSPVKAQQPSTLSYQSIKLKQQQLLQPTAQNLNLNQPSPKQPLPKLEGHVVKQIVAYRNKSSKDLDDKEDNHLLDQKGIGQQESKKGINEKDLKKDIGKGNSPAVGPEQVTILQGNVKKKSRIELPSNQNSLKINGSNGAHTNTSEANELNAAKGKKK